MELYFRRKGASDINDLISLLKLTNGTLDDFLFERLKQDAIIYPETFHFLLCDKICNEFSKTTLALRIALLMLDLPDQDQERAKQSFSTALKIVETGSVADGEIKSSLLVKLAQFSVSEFHNTKKSHELIDMILQTGLINTSMIYAAEAALLKSRLYIYEEDFKKAESILEQYAKLFKESGRDRMFSGDLAAESDMEARLTFEKGVLETHKQNFQEALNLLKEVVEKHPESFWVNDSLELALLISRGSTGNFSMLESFLKAERLNLTGKTDKAIEELNKEIKNQTATSTGILLDMKSMQLLISYNSENPESLAKRVEEFIENNPTFHTTPDLMCLNMKLKKKMKVSDFKFNEYLQKFVDKFPDDLRSSRFKKRIRAKVSEKQETAK
jgi:tetratricopeptide (TPR) repeat protein